MSAQYTLDAIRTAANAKYGHTEIALDEKTTVKLLNPMRLSKEIRTQLSSIQDEMTGDDVDQVDVFRKALLLVAEVESQGQALIDAIGDDLALLAEVFGTYTKGTSAGEASASAN